MAGRSDSDDDLGSAPTQTPAEAAPQPSASGRTGFRAVEPGHALGGRYEIVDELGEGGMATVFRARDRELRRDVAIKVLFPHLARRADVVRRFDREARAAAGLEHPNILRVYDVGGGTEAGGDPPFIVMELVRGNSLKDEIDARGPLFAELCACAGALLADALVVAHAAGVIHRDVKPANVMVAQGGRLLLADFGVARVDDDDSVVTRTGALLGTPAFMAPEQATGAEVDARSDVYSLGATLYQLATGVLPYSGPAPKVIAQIAAGELVSPARRRPAIGRELSRVIERMMAADPDRRPASAAAAAVELRALVADGGFGEPADELAAYFAEPEAFVARRTPGVVSALVDSARRARADGKIPRAIALVDRASALAPGDPSITTLVDALSGRRRRAVWIAALAIAAVVAGGAAVAWRYASRGDAPATDAATAIATVADAAQIVAVVDPIDAAIPAVDAPVAIAVQPRRADAAPRAARDAAIASLAPDAAVAAIASPPDAAAHGFIKVVMDTWCDVTIDDVAYGRADPARAIEVSPGSHEVACSKGAGLASWKQRVDVPAGKTHVVRGTLLAATRVTIGIKRGDRAVIRGKSYARGARVDLAPGRHSVEVYDGSRLVVRDWVTVTTVERCEIRELTNPEGQVTLDCFR
jgi:serine/threonine-protein kinase